MDTSGLEKWAELLLDTGKGNNLINFKDTRSGSAEIIAPDFMTLFQKVEHAIILEVFDPKLEDDEDPFGEIEIVSKQSYLASYGSKLKKNRILLYNPSGKPIQALKTIAKKANSALEETGVNIAHLALGFIYWTESENSKTEMCAPLLLLPISIERYSAVNPICIRVLDDEMLVNPTFSYKLQNEYGIRLPDYDEDIGIESYLKSVSDLLTKLKWRVSAECKISIFSFQKINMYQDLKENALKIIQNENIRALLGEKIPYVEPQEKRDLMDLTNVVDADSSQAEAIEAAREGTSFVLQGPPGTGKSQTITNIIAECLWSGKKVLFVSEKLAALNVVYDKLKKAGLEEFCLELHSHKANKKSIIEEFCRTLKLPRSALSEKADRELNLKKEAQCKLDEYAMELHRRHAVINRSLYQLYEEFAAYRFVESVPYVIDGIGGKGEEFIEKAEDCLNHYVNYSATIGADYHKNIWYGFKPNERTYRADLELKTDLSSSTELFGKLISLGEDISKETGLSPLTIGDFETLCTFFAAAGDSKFMTPSLLNASGIKSFTEDAKKLKAISENLENVGTALFSQYDEKVCKLDGEVIFKKLTGQYSGRIARLFSREYREILAGLRLCKKDGKKINYASAVSAAELLRTYCRLGKEFEENQVNLSAALASAHMGPETDFSWLLEELAVIRNSIENFDGITTLCGLSREEYSALIPHFRNISKHYTLLIREHGEAFKRILRNFDARECDILKMPLRELLEKLSGCVANIDKLDNWCDFLNLLERAKGLSLRGYIDFAIARRMPVESFLPVYKKAFYAQWIDCILRESPILTELSRVPHDEMIARFKEKDTLNFDINKAKIKAKLSAERPDLHMIAQGSAVSILLRENEKKRKKKGIRQLLQEIGDLALTLKPCFLMSPLSVSTYLDPDMKFDIVIFDEASQIFPQDAIGAIYRGRQLIVVGDSRQMPPSNFFQSASAIDDEDEGDEGIADFESILDLCSTAFPQRRLKWHYRSRFEQLISFSNKNFYDNDLITFPSAQGDMEGAGVDYYFVNGVFDRKSKTNRIEAERIVDLVFENIRKYPERSLGVVAFSISQQDLIDKLIFRRRRENAEFEEFFKSDRAEPFFVKNLETVQGDERDTIIFSIAYAKDEQGKFLMNFGPLNREGGERRLNVAVTRAKINVQLVASIHSHDIDLSRTSSTGARLLREYLDYAENGAIALQRELTVNAFDRFDSEFEMEVCEFLREKGYTVDMQVGCSAFRIDLALKRPDSSDYLLAIECDGATYHSSVTARDRDRLRQEILERMGWRFYRIWSTDWFRNREIEKERLLDAVRRALEKAPVKKTLVASSFEKEAAESGFEFPKYETADVVRIAKMYNKNILPIVLEIAKKEAPLSEEWLLKRIVFLFGGREKVTNAVRQKYEVLMWNCERWGLERRDGFLYLTGQEIPLLRIPAENTEPREIGYIAVEELSTGLLEILKRNISVEKQGLFRLTVQLLGFNRMSEATVDRLEKALSLLNDKVDINNETVTIR